MRRLHCANSELRTGALRISSHSLPGYRLPYFWVYGCFARSASKGDLVTANFARAEFRCRCGCGLDDVAPLLVDSLQAVRDILGRPVIVTSGCRCGKHNAAIGGARNSLHVRGQAADIRVGGMTPREVYHTAVRRVPALAGVGVSDQGNFLHVDIRIRPARWCYRAGRHVPWFDLSPSTVGVG